MRSILSRTARIFAPIRRLIASRDAVFLEGNDALSARDAAYAATLNGVLDLASPVTYLRARLNGCPLWLPRDTLLTMTHCAHGEPDGALTDGIVMSTQANLEEAQIYT